MYPDAAEEVDLKLPKPYGKKELDITAAMEGLAAAMLKVDAISA